jgi:tetratricopeptide (TPR) repeat protein
MTLEALRDAVAAIPLYQQCLASPTRGDDASLRLAKLYRNLRQPGKSITILKELLARRPRLFAALDILGETLAQLKRITELEALVEDQILRSPGPHIWNILAIHLKTAGQREKAADLWRQAARQYPNVSIIAYNLGHLLNELSYAEEAERHLRRAIVLDGHYARAWNALAVSLEIQHRYDEAILALDSATMLNPRMASAWLNKGIALRATNDFAAAIENFRKAITIDKNHAVAHQNLAYTLLFVGEIEQGFKEYDWRWHVPDFPSTKRLYKHPVWDGRSLPQEGLVVWMEQGMGDEVMFSWYLPLVRQRVKRLIVDCDPRLIPIFERSFPSIEYVARDITTLNPRTIEADIKFKAPAGHLPKFYFAETHAAIRETWDYAGKAYTRAPAYLKADPVRQAYWRQLLRDRFGDKFIVGISWRSAVRTRMRDMQYPELEQIAGLLGHDVVAVNCQYSWKDEELAQLEQHGRDRGFTFFHPPGIDLKDDLDDVFALASVLDLVISPLISLPWMAGAVGTPCWVLRTNETSRIWQQLGTPYVPWAPSIRLFFRHPLESWDIPARRIHAELGALVSAETALRRQG